MRPTWGAQEHRRGDRLVAEHHYLVFHGVIGKGLRHVAVHGETWVAMRSNGSVSANGATTRFLAIVAKSSSSVRKLCTDSPEAVRLPRALC